MILLFSLFQAQAEPHYDTPKQIFYEEKKSSKNTIRNRDSEASFVELNFGLAAMDDIAFPGASLLFGTTFSNSGVVYEFQVGAAFPSIATAKIGLGGGDLDYNFLITVRPWPFFIGPQVKLNNWTFSLEVGTGTQASFNAIGIGTIGYRWIF